MALNNNISFSVALVATLVVLFAATTNSQATNHCTVADDKALCIALIKGAKTWPEAMTNALEATLQKANVAKTVVDGIPKKLSSTLTPQSKESIEQTCKDAYQNIIDNSKECLGYVKNGDPMSSLKTYLSTIGYTDCVDGLNEFGESLPEVSQFNTEMRKFAGTLLAIADTNNKD
ncbi:pectinesterase inhibitor-like [Olea europaea subsp. europaea]|jgi:pectinesterase inhibitor-like protein|uniref:Pectinesterase inhibitor-like n=1 Tax=Olea europaea subsp. europaea TaxID=158383 RepID=A0A8S0UJZ2_OLEEU|nr:pectinesterase inhibitor-like [Olea europaea subsp. europaea]